MSDKRITGSIALGADHGGFDLKEHLRRWLAEQGYTVDDCGIFQKQTADYPKVAADVARRVADGRCEVGIMVDGAGIGSSMVANKFPGVRAALCYDVSSARNSREHNNANVLTLGGTLIGAGLAEQIVSTWLTTACTVDRHLKRVGMIDEIDQQFRSGKTGSCGCSAKQAPSSGDVHPSGNPTPSAPAGTIQEIAQLHNLTPEDLERITARIVELLAAGGLTSGLQCACCGPGCREHCAEKDPKAIRGFIGAGADRIGHGLGGGPLDKELAKYIDHTLLKPDATRKQVEQLCKEAAEFGFASVCVNPNWVKLCADLLKGTGVLVCTVAGFPLGTHVPEIKAQEARRAIRDGAKEVDMVINIGALKSGDDDLVYRDIAAVTDACRDGRAICKVIIECALLTDDEKVRACVLAKKARAEFVKTSTGFASGGATVQDVALMRQAVGGTRMEVKAAGGIRSYDDLKSMVAAGATRIGASAGIQIMKQAAGVTVSGDAPVGAAKTKGGNY